MSFCQRSATMERRPLQLPSTHGIFSRLRGQRRRPAIRCALGSRICHGQCIAWDACGEGAGHSRAPARRYVAARTVREAGLKLLLKKLFFQVFEEAGRWGLPVGTMNAAYWHHYLGDDVPLFLMPYAVDNDYFQKRSVEARAGRDKLMQELNLVRGQAGHSVCIEAATAESTATIYWKPIRAW